MIVSFHKKATWFLSNFYPLQTPLVYGKYRFMSSECAYMSAKRHDIKWKEFCENATPAEAKAKSKTIQLRPDWEQVKIRVLSSM